MNRLLIRRTAAENRISAVEGGVIQQRAAHLRRGENVDIHTGKALCQSTGIFLHTHKRMTPNPEPSFCI